MFAVKWVLNYQLLLRKKDILELLSLKGLEKLFNESSLNRETEFQVGSMLSVEPDMRLDPITLRS